MAALIALVVGLVVYLQIVSIQFHVNDSSDRSDQSAYMIFSRTAFVTQFHYTGDRNRMPLYPWIQAAFYSPELTELAFFDQGKRINTLISLLGICFIGIAFFLRFSKPFALHSLIVIAYLLFALKAPWFQAEILFYILLWLAFVIAIESIRKPAWSKSVALGLSFALAHFTKASALPGLIIYSMSFVAPLIQVVSNHSSGRLNLVRTLGYAVAPVVIFTVLLLPYFHESNERYGQFLYNVNTTFYMWYDSWDEAVEGTKRAGDRSGWPDLPQEEIPSLAKYLSEHSTEDIIQRFRNSASKLLTYACIRPDSRQRYGNCIHIAASATIFLASSVYFLTRSVSLLRVRHIHAALFSLSFLVLYVLSSLWYYPIINGTRIVFALVLPLYWSFGLAERHAGIDRFTVVFRGHSFRPIRIVYAVLILVAIIQVYELVTFRAAQLFAGF